MYWPALQNVAWLAAAASAQDPFFDRSQGFGGSVDTRLETYGSSDAVRSMIHRPASPANSWLGWGGNVYNNRWAGEDALIDSSNAKTMVNVCNMTFLQGVSSTPTVSGDVAYFPSFGGQLVALDYQRCSKIWELNVTKIVNDFKPFPDVAFSQFVPKASRTSPVLHAGVLYVGTLANALVLAVNQTTGRLIDLLQLDTHPFAIITQSPTFYDDKLLVGVSSQEELAADLVANYSCCNFTGSMNAVRLVGNKLQRVWRTGTIPQGTNFSGAAVWGSAPPIDRSRNQVFFATGNLYSIPPAYEDCQSQTANISVIAAANTSDPCLPRDVYQESVLALDLDTGFINWATQLSSLDAYNVACNKPSMEPQNCPAHPGPDADFGMAPGYVPASKYTPHGKDVVVIGQKNGNLYALSAQAGRPLWSTVTGPDGSAGGLQWGIAVDDRSVYYTVINSLHVNWTITAGPDKGKVISHSAWGAVNLTDGSITWETIVPNDTESIYMPTIVNDVVLTGITSISHGPQSEGNGTDGSLVALDKKTGRILAQYPLHSYSQGAVAVVKDYALLGTGYTTTKDMGSLQVYRAKGKQGYS